MRVFQDFRLSSSTCMRPQNDSITALSYGHPIGPDRGGKAGLAYLLAERPRRKLGAAVGVNYRGLRLGLAGVWPSRERSSPAP